MTNEQCENCAFAKWVADYDEMYGYTGYVDECKRQFGIKHIDDKYYYDPYFDESIENVSDCPFFIPQELTEEEITRCPMCNCPRTHFKHVDEDYNNCNMSCEHCNHTWIGKIPYLYW